MTHFASLSDKTFLADFEAGHVPPADFDHRAHVRLAYVLLCDLPLAKADARMTAALKRFLERNNVPPEKFHVTLTHAWLKAVQYFMTRSPSTESFDAFLECDDRLLDSKIMMTHYSKGHLFSETARLEFVEPDLSAIPA